MPDPDISAFSGLLGNRKAAHLLRRSTFGPTKAQILAFANKTPAQAMSDLLAFNSITSKPIDPYITVPNSTWVDTLPDPQNGSDNNLRRNLVIGWMMHNFRLDNTLRSKMIFFLHQNWIVDIEAWNSHELYDHLKMLEFYSLGSYKTLAKKMCRDNRMLVYLSGYLNTAANPNENFAREFLELFTIGKGPQIAPGNYTNYTEIDIKEAAKLLSGYWYDLNNAQVDPDTGIRRCNLDPYQTQHSQVNKTFSAALGNTTTPTTIVGTNTAAGMEQEVDQYVELIFGNIETAKNISRKLYRYFLHRNITPAVETFIITPMANALAANNYNLSSAVNLLLQSNHFYDLDDANPLDNKIGSMVKSPLELILNTTRFFNINPEDLPGANPISIWDTFYISSIKYSFLLNSNMRLFDATTVAGYPAYYAGPKFDRNWFDQSSVTQRYYLGRCLLENLNLPYASWSSFGAKIDIVTWVKNNISNPYNGTLIVEEMINYLFAEIPDAARRTYFLNQTLLGTLSLTNWATEWNAYILSLSTDTPNLTVVKPRLELLFKAILFSQEFQLQ